ncbi:MAG TPA: hypothetical protein DCM28_02705 [Phycisphaerales bacterium]|nr:hypothetical protein [Phycisphaerales bacterium]HCD32809.1 hypothetical protein [Phycisphaerales bacterium]|tara:strand:- start:815 stop:1402 length:588 start_codon:yes stop_codon:yes gene_type:complete
MSTFGQLIVLVSLLAILPSVTTADESLADFFDAKHIDAWRITGQNQGPTAAVKATDEKTPGEKSALVFCYDITKVKKLAYTHFALKEAFAFQTMPKSLSFEVKGDKSNHPVRIVCNDANGRTHQWTITPINWDGWKTITCDMTYPRAGYGTWGGKDDDKQVKLPLKFVGFVIDRRKVEDEDTGQVLIGGATVNMD